MHTADNKTFYTLLIYTENIAGTLSQVSSVFTRRQVNIESINASASSIEGVHKYTITTWTDARQIEMIKKQIEKKMDVIKVNYYTDSQLFIREVGLYKLSTAEVLANPEISRVIRSAEARMIEVNSTFCTAMISGNTEDIMNLYFALDRLGCVLQYTRSGRIAVTRSTVEQVSDFLDMQEQNKISSCKEK